MLSYQDVATMYLTFRYRPPHEQDPGGLRCEKKQNEAGVGSSHEQASASASALCELSERYRVAARSQRPDQQRSRRRKLIRENELKEEKERQARYATRPVTQSTVESTLPSPSSSRSSPEDQDKPVASFQLRVPSTHRQQRPEDVLYLRRTSRQDYTMAQFAGV